MYSSPKYGIGAEGKIRYSQ